MHVILYPSDGLGSGCYRIIWPGEALIQTGKPLNVIPRSPEIVVIGNPPEIKGISTGSASLVVFQRPGSSQMLQVIPLLQRKGVKVVIDMDDNVSHIHPRNPVFKVYDPKINPNKNWEHLQKACELANWLTVTTPRLAEQYGQHGRVTVIPNHIPQRYLTIPRVKNVNVVSVGWAGWTSNHQNDLAQTRGAVNMALTETKNKSRFLGFGDSDIFTQLQIKQREPHELLGFTNIHDYPNRLVRFDIGLVPLEKSVFNECKSWLKTLEYCSLGIVPVVTPTPDNQRLVDLGAAIPASTPREWHLKVKELIEDDEMRQTLSEHCRKVASGFTIEGNTDLWWKTWEMVNNL